MARTHSEELAKTEQVDDGAADIAAEYDLKRGDRKKAKLYDLVGFLAGYSESGGTARFGEISDHFPGLGASLLQGYLKDLIQCGLVEKPDRNTYRIATPPSSNFYTDTAYERRQNIQPDIKVAVALGCLRQLRGDVVPLLSNRYCFISQGTSTAPLFNLFKTVDLNHLPDRVVTNSLPGFLELLNFGPIDLTIVGGKPDPSCGAIRPQGILSAETEKQAPGVLPRWLGGVHFNTVILSCSAIDPGIGPGDDSLRIFCGDDMEDFRKSIIELPDVEIIILADTTKFQHVPVGVKVDIHIDWSRTWVFVDDSPAETTKPFFEKFREKLGRQFVPVPVPKVVQS